MASAHRESRARDARITPGRRSRLAVDRPKTGVDDLDDPVDIVDAACPRPATRSLERRPEPRVVRQIAMRAKFGMSWTIGEQPTSLPGIEFLPADSHQIHVSRQIAPVDDDVDDIAVHHFAD